MRSSGTGRQTGMSVRVPGCQKLQIRLNPVWHRMFHSCAHTATVGVKGLNGKQQDLSQYSPDLVGTRQHIRRHQCSATAHWPRQYRPSLHQRLQPIKYSIEPK